MCNEANETVSRNAEAVISSSTVHENQRLSEVEAQNGLPLNHDVVEVGMRVLDPNILADSFWFDHVSECIPVSSVNPLASKIRILR